MKHFADGFQHLVGGGFFAGVGVLPQQLHQTDEETLDGGFPGGGQAPDETLDAVGQRRCRSFPIFFLLDKTSLRFTIRRIKKQFLGEEP